MSSSRVNRFSIGVGSSPLASFVLGAAYAAWTIATQSHVTNSSVLLILLSVVIFLIGLVSEQISSLRFEGRER